MFRQAFALFLLLVLSAQAKHLVVDKDMQIREIPASIADFVINDPNINAYVQFKDDLASTGWVYYYYKASSANPDWMQMYLAGYMEGYSAYYLIHDTWLNFNDSFTGLSQDVTSFIDEQLSWVAGMVEDNPKSEYWNAVNLTLSQMHGIYDGFQVGIQTAGRPDLNITFSEYYMIVYLMDLGDITGKFSGDGKKYPSCSFLAKIVGENLYVSHTTWFGYNLLMRSYKTLDLSIQNSFIKTQKISYSGLPGSVASQDDWYVLDNARVVTETSLLTDNSAVYSFIKYSTVPYWIRITVANLMYDTQEHWRDIFFAYRSGTYNNQWLVIDFNNWNTSKNNLSEAKDVIWMIEEFYQLTSSQDVTQQLLVPQGYVASYNVPYTAAIQNLSMNPTNYTTDERAVLFKKYAPGIQSMADFQYVMRLNNVSDSGDYCEAIASRCDLNPNTTSPWGAVDCKMTGDAFVSNHQSWIISGPTHETEEPFSWLNWPEVSNMRNGMPDVYDFDWVFIDPSNNYTASAPEHGSLASDASYAFIMESSWRREQAQSVINI